jgi:hypothetical protein
LAIFNLENLRLPLLASLDKLGTVDPLLLRGLSLILALIIYSASSRLKTGTVITLSYEVLPQPSLNHLESIGFPEVPHLFFLSPKGRGLG